MVSTISNMFVLRQSLGMYDDIARHLAECDTKLQAELKNLGEKKIDLGKPPRFGSKQRPQVDITRINGLGVTAVTKKSSRHFGKLSAGAILEYCAQVAKLVDAPASGAGGFTTVEVRVFSWAP